MLVRIVATIISTLAFLTSVSHANDQLLSIAVQQLENQGHSLPPGASPRLAEPGELSGDLIAETDFETGEIVIDGERVDLWTTAWEDDGQKAQATVALYVTILHHEYGHTDSGEVSDPGFPGYGNGPCKHFDLYEANIDFACQLAGMEAGPTTVYEVNCAWVQTMLVFREGMIDKQNENCTPKAGRRFLCEECTLFDD